MGLVVAEVSPRNRNKFDDIDPALATLVFGYKRPRPAELAGKLLLGHSPVATMFVCGAVQKLPLPPCGWAWPIGSLKKYRHKTEP